MLGDGGGGSCEADGEIQIGSGGDHHVDLFEMVVESVGIRDESVENFESGEKSFFILDVGDAVEVDVTSGFDQDLHAMIRGGGKQEGGFRDSADTEDVVEEMAGVGGHRGELFQVGGNFGLQILDFVGEKGSFLDADGGDTSGGVEGGEHPASFDVFNVGLVLDETLVIVDGIFDYLVECGDEKN